jgi:hypothetical protein
MVSAKYGSSSVAICSLGSLVFLLAGRRWLSALDSKSKCVVSFSRADSDIVEVDCRRLSQLCRQKGQKMVDRLKDESQSKIDLEDLVNGYFFEVVH